MNVHTLAARSAATLVAAIAGAASWEHIASVAYAAGERAWVAYSLPAAIDGLILVGVAALLEDRRHERGPRMSARVAVLVGVLATLAANVASAEPGLRAALVAVAAPIAFMLSVEVLARAGRQLPDPGQSDAKPRPTGASGDAPERPARRRAGGKRTAGDRVASARRRYPSETQTEIAKRLKISPRTAARYWHWHATGADTTPDNEPNSRQHAGVPELAAVGETHP